MVTSWCGPDRLWPVGYFLQVFSGALPFANGKLTGWNEKGDKLYPQRSYKNNSDNKTPF